MRTIVLLWAVVFALTVADEAQDVDIQPKAVNIDAAFRYENHLFFISGDEYMKISHDGFEMWTKKRGGGTHVPVDVHIQAAITWPGKTRIYYYGSDRSYRVDQPEKGLVEKEYRVGREFLQSGGPDAASYRRGWFYIFKGCQYASQQRTLWHLGSPQNVTELGLPCNIDAAWSDEDFKGMTILKGDQIWHWGDTLEGPTPFAEKYHIWSWHLQAHPDDRFEL